MKDGGPAFPYQHDPDTHRHLDSAQGMSLRDYFAAAALQGMNANSLLKTGVTQADMAKIAYAKADAMLAEREEQ